ncbi:MAG TPA: protein kinase [Thermoanaerobaculia bacterium]
MTLTAGTRLGPYELVAPIGAGGMGEVYRAKDTRLDRTVAVKVLPAHLSSSPDSRQRFEREAKTISQLSHPHICALYDVGHQDGVEYLVMEYLEGETLADRILKGPLEFEQVLERGIEIADALEKAHRQGIIHRDLKPGNVMLTKAGVKLLDFGLAKVVTSRRSLDATGREQEAAAQHPMAGRNLTTIPTAIGNLTAEGTILGTFQYMAPEQLEGKDADARTDIFAFGCVLYEMATGRKAFTGASQASLISAIMGSQPPPISAVAPTMPRAFDRVVRTCLAKDPDDRWQSAADAARQLEWTAEDGGTSPSLEPIPARRVRSWLPWLVAAAAVVAAVATPFLRRAPKAESVVRFTLSAPPGQQLGPSAALSPDGRRIAFISNDPSGKATLWMRSLDGLALRSFPGTEAARYPFWSPDGRSIGFFSGQRLRRVEADGGTPQTICRSGLGFGGTWGPDGTILFSSAFGNGILAVSAAGGEPVPATAVVASRGDSAHLWPVFLPDGRHFVLIARNFDPEKSVIALATLGSTETRPLFHTESGPIWADPGYLLFARESTLLAQRFDPDKLRLVGEAMPVVERIRFFTPETGVLASASSNGTLLYGVWNHQKRIVSVDRKGREIGTLGDIGDYEEVVLSPDGRRAAVTKRDGARGQNLDLWIVDAVTGVSSRFTSDRTDEMSPSWLPDGDRVNYITEHAGFYDFSERAVSGGPERAVFQSKYDKTYPEVSPDGKFLAFCSSETGGFNDLAWLPLTGESRTVTVDKTAEFDETFIAFSPDSRWLAYQSDESGQTEVYVRRFPDGPGQRVSSSGGGMPVWRRDGKELFFVSRDGMLMAVAVNGAGPRMETGSPQPLFEIRLNDTILPFRRKYDVYPDGERFLVIRRAAESDPDTIAIALNWTGMLKKK